MKIQRTINGMKFNIELLPDELEEAYFEQQEKFDIEDVVSYLEAYNNEELVESYGLNYSELIKLKEEIAEKMRKNIDKYGMNMPDSREEALREVIRIEKGAVIA